MGTGVLLDEAYIMARVQIDESGCWRWRLSRHSSGYGRHVTTTAHRVSYRIFKGEIPEGLHLDHLCRVRDCVNPDHLEAVTPAENTRRADANAIRRDATHCINGHPFDEANTYWRAATVRTRDCRICTAARQRKYQKRKREMAA